MESGTIAKQLLENSAGETFVIRDPVGLLSLKAVLIQSWSGMEAVCLATETVFVLVCSSSFVDVSIVSSSPTWAPAIANRVSSKVLTAVPLMLVIFKPTLIPLVSAGESLKTVSYTHLTLPTILLV